MVKSPSDDRTRPTSDRLRETLFNILAPRIDQDTRFLDLCAGSGAIGIEALSRGSQSAIFVDKSRRSCALIEENLDLLDIPEHQTGVFCSAADKYIQRNRAYEWDIIYFDPPYEVDYGSVLSCLGDPLTKNLADQGILVAEHHTKNELPDMIGGIRRWRVLKQGESCLCFYERN